MDKHKKAVIIISVILGTGGLLYLGGILGQVLANYRAWLGGNGISGEEMMKPPDWNLAKAEGVILGEYEGKAVCMPKDTRLNRHIAIFGASGTMKSRAVIRNALFQALKRGESVVITDPKAEL